ncbi:MAG: hypothetical protein J0I34_23245 [Pseudonocardia sp.]|uniref:aldolase/citrate lyase family protein n=1 Tax=unclassified Pseudonocardia TaxID=2619320 RepID=UPI001AD178AD|nr:MULTISPECIES: aldolase/citrate lyase family protein [unclassified Pseudonocardia]MBN9111687.1 hypothetical protein [Pseudonocardia sp.]
MTPTSVHRSRARLRQMLAQGHRVVGTFVKLAPTDVLEAVAGAGWDLAVVDLEHSGLTDGEALALVRHGDALGLPVVVRAPTVDRALVNRLLEAGAAGIQLSSLASLAQLDALRAAAHYSPTGDRSVSLGHRAAGYGGTGLRGYLDAERENPPLLVGQIEGPTADPVEELAAGLDVVFVGTTDLQVALGLDPAVRADADRLRDEIAGIERAAAAAGVAFGGWAPADGSVDGLGLTAATYVLLGSDLQLLGAALTAHRPETLEEA